MRDSVWILSTHMKGQVWQCTLVTHVLDMCNPCTGKRQVRQRQVSPGSSLASLAEREAPNTVRNLVSKKQGRKELRKALVNPETVRFENKIK